VVAMFISRSDMNSIGVLADYGNAGRQPLRSALRPRLNILRGPAREEIQTLRHFSSIWLTLGI
jgi:hypothetical protein